VGVLANGSLWRRRMRIVRRLNLASSGYEPWTVKASLGPAFFLWTKLSAVSDSAALRRLPGFRTRVPRATPMMMENSDRYGVYPDDLHRPGNRARR
jgi:hypothetical protein